MIQFRISDAEPLIHGNVVLLLAADGELLPITGSAALVPAETTVEPVAADVVRRLTQRERQVLSLMAEGLTNADISTRFTLSPATVRTHVSRILAKTGSRDRTQAVVLAYRSGLIRVRPDG